MADITLYLDANLTTGLNDGSSAANAWQSWATAVTGLNTNYGDLVTAQTSVDVMVSGQETVVNGTSIGDITVTCSETYPLRFVGDSVNRAEWDAANIHIDWQGGQSAPRWCITTSTAATSYIVLFGLRIQCAPTTTSTLNGFFQSGVPSDYVVVDSCYFKSTGNKTSGNMQHLVAAETIGSVDVFNTVLEDFTSSHTNFYAGFYSRDPGASLIANCTVINCDTLQSNNGSGNTGTLTLVNTLFSACPNYIQTGTPVSGSSGKNATSTSANPPGSDNTVDAVFSFVSATDRHLQAANDWGAGPDDATYGAFVPTTDIDGEVRDGITSDAGADQFAAARPALSNPQLGTNVTGGTLTSTTMSASVVSDTDSVAGLLYGSLYSSASSPTEQQIKDGTGTDFVQKRQIGATGTPGEQIFPDFTGLTPGQTYYLYCVQEEPADGTFSNVTTVVSLAAANVGLDAVTASTPTDNELPAGSTASFSFADGGLAFAGIYASGSSPTAAQIRTGAGTGYVAGTVQTNVAITGGTATFAEFAGLPASTALELWVTGEDANAVECVPATLSDAFTTLQQQLTVPVPLVNVETGANWPDGSTVRWDLWQSADWHTGLAAADENQAVTADGGILTIITQAVPVSTPCIAVLHEDVGGAGVDAGDNFGTATGVVTRSLVNQAGAAQYLAVPTDSENWQTLTEYFAAQQLARQVRMQAVYGSPVEGFEFTFPIPLVPGFLELSRWRMFRDNRERTALIQSISQVDDYTLYININDGLFAAGHMATLKFEGFAPITSPAVLGFERSEIIV